MNVTERSGRDSPSRRCPLARPGTALRQASPGPGPAAPVGSPPLLHAATQAGVTRFIVTHANWSLCKLDLDVQRELIAKGATMEYVACSCVSPIFWEQQPGELAEWIIALRGENIVLGSDLGQFAGLPHPESLRMLLAALIDIGVPQEYLEKMAKQTPALLGLDPDWSLPGSSDGNAPAGP